MLLPVHDVEKFAAWSFGVGVADDHSGVRQFPEVSGHPLEGLRRVSGHVVGVKVTDHRRHPRITHTVVVHVGPEPDKRQPGPDRELDDPFITPELRFDAADSHVESPAPPAMIRRVN